MVNGPSDKVLGKIYDKAFEQKADHKQSWPGDAHAAGLRAIYDRGRSDGAMERRREA
jgi:hypothetical protein